MEGDAQGKIETLLGEKPNDNGYNCNDQDQNNPVNMSATHQVTPFGFSLNSPGVWVTSCDVGMLIQNVA